MRIKKKAMLIEFSDHTTNYIFTKMQRYIDIHTCITNTPEKFNKKKFLNTKILHNHECLNGRNFEIKKIINYYDKLSSLDQKILIFLFKRQNIKNLDEKKLVKFINYLFTGWDKYIKKNNINFLIFYLNPHLVYSYIIYIIAKKRG